MNESMSLASLLDEMPEVAPLDDRALVAHVHPTDWQNPPPRARYNLVVIGGGTAGLVTARAGRCWGLWSNSSTMAWIIHLPLESGEAPVCVSNFSSSCAAMRVRKRPLPM